jgi:AcrR family transcriptional regulator
MASAGRRPGPTATRDDILAAARRLFGEKGYDATTVRAIAAEAGVSPAMIRHFFGTKEQVFVAVLEFPVSPADAVPLLLDGPREEFGRRLAGLLVTIWREPRTRAPLLAVLRSSMTNESAARLLRDFLTTAIVRRAAEGLDVPPIRITAAMGQVVGMLLMRYVLEVEPIASAGDDDFAALVADTVQRTLDR